MTAPATPPPPDLFAEWQAVDDALRRRRIVYGIATREQVAGKSGLELFKAMIAGELPAPPISQTLDFLLVEADHGRVVFQGRPGFAHYNPMGSVHGGWFATLLDSALGCAVASTLPAGKGYTTAELKVNIVRPLNDRVPFVRAEGRIIHGGNRMATADARLTGPDGKLYAHGSTTCFVFDAP
ncbi:MAG TPA: PaaI family thioesterase [Caldimonas sp.]|nr:PaaI family thioesterase [Caldimonas sp.]